MMIKMKSVFNIKRSMMRLIEYLLSLIVCCTCISNVFAEEVVQLSNILIVIEAPPEGYGVKPDPSWPDWRKNKFIKKNAPIDRPYNEIIKHPSEDLQHYLGKMTGENIPIVVDGLDELVKGKIQIHIGRTKEALKENPDVPSGFNPIARKGLFGEEGYIINVKKKRIYLLGNQDGPYLGTAYAVYNFLYDLGVRWYFPGAWGEVIPHLKNVVAPIGKKLSKPDFSIRNIGMSGWVKMTKKEIDEYRRWSIRNRLNPHSYKSGRRGFHTLYPNPIDGSIASLLPYKEYAKEHPEYYAMNERGEQPHWGKAKRFHANLCLSNPETLKQSVNNLKDAYAGKRRMHGVNPVGIGISPPDGAPFCYCNFCKGKNLNFNYPTYVHRPMLSEPYYNFACKLAEAIPEKVLTVQAYSNREMPPIGIKKFPSNVAVLYAPIATDVLHPLNHPNAWRKQETYEILKTYCELSEHVIWRDYSPGLLLTDYVPERDAENFAKDVKIFKELGVRGVSREGRKALMATWLTYYVTARMTWDTNESLEAIKNDFYPTFFGPAGKHMRLWWDACAKRLGNAKIQAHEAWLLNNIYTPEFVNSIRPHINASIKFATAQPYKGRVEAVRLIAENLAGYAEMWAAERKLDYPLALKGAVKMEKAKTDLHAISGFFINSGMTKRLGFMCAGNNVRLQKLIDLTDGKTGRKIANIPAKASFKRDLFNEGVIYKWYADNYPDKGWGTKDTFLFWEQQEPFLDEKGHDYDGLGWYRIQVNIPKENIGKPLRLRLGGAINEAWVWLNGKFIGHSKHKLWWNSPHEVDLDITSTARAGKNIIAVRILNDAEIGGLYRRGFIYQPVIENAKPK